MAQSPAERQRNKRARDKAERERTGQTAEKVAIRIADHDINMAWALEQDTKDFFYKGECRSCADLLAIYEGADISVKESDDDDADEVIEKAKKAKKKEDEQVRPNPSLNQLSIRAISLIDMGIEVNIDPDQWDYQPLQGGDKINLRKLYEVDEVVAFRRWLDLRDKARKNLFWLCNLVGMPMFHRSHQMICDMFVQKNFDGMFFPGFNKLDLTEMIGRQTRVAKDGKTPTRMMLLFAPRSGRKSTIDGIDAVQWMLACPDIRIMIATAYRDLAKQLFAEIKGYFFLPISGTPSSFQILFPEYVLYGRAGSSDSPVKCPAARVPSKEPHLWKTSMEASSIGKRCDIRKLDDVVDYRNSDTEELRVGLERKINATSDLVEPWGFTDVVATRYFTTDWYGTRTSVDADKNEPDPYSYLSISAWTPKKGFEARYEALLKEPNGLFKVTEDMVDLWFPQKLSFAVLKSKLKEKKEISFKNQQLNIATDPKELDEYINQFDIETLRGHQYPREKTPKGLEIIQSWDIAYSENSRTSDWTVSATIGFYRDAKGQACVVILEVFFEKLQASEMAPQLIKMYEKYRPSKVYVEDSNGMRFFQEALAMHCKRLGCDLMASPSTLSFRPISNRPNAKRERIKTLEMLLGNERLFFVGGPWIEETFKQFSEYKGGKSTKYRKDDIPDAVSLGVVSHLPASQLQLAPDPKDVARDNDKDAAERRRRTQMLRMFANTPSPTKPQLAPEPQGPPRDPRWDALTKHIAKILPPGMRKRF